MNVNCITRGVHFKLERMAAQAGHGQGSLMFGAAAAGLKQLKAIDTKRAELGLSRRPAPNPVAGLGSGDAPDTKPSSWAGAFAEHTGRAKPQ